MIIILWIIAIIYCASPVDLMPGPIDDAIVAFVVFGITSVMNSSSQSKKK